MANARRRTQRANRSSTRSTSSSTVMAATMESDAGRGGKTVDWEHELRYINKDLRDLLVISVILFVLLFAVGFFI